jgi:protease-4
MTDSEGTISQTPEKHGGTPLWLRLLFGLLLWVVVPIVIGVLVGRRLFPSPAVGIIRLNTDIYTDSVAFIEQQIEEARANPRIKAIVLQIESPGGEVVATQTLYLELQALRNEMPVVGSVDGWAASGAYYAAMATDPIFAKPSSTVGNVGVWGYFPSELGVNDVILASGPFKLTASNTEEFLREIDGIKREFLATVVSQRGARLTISSEELSQGLAYPGRQAMEKGLIDRLGTQEDAIKEAAAQAKIKHYKVIDLEQVVIEKYYSYEEEIYYQPWVAQADPKTGHRELPLGIYLLYDVRIGSTR